MLLTKSIHGDYTISSMYYQLNLPLNLEISIPSDDSVRLLSAFVEEMDLSELYKTYDRIRKKQASPRQMLKIVLYTEEMMETEAEESAETGESDEAVESDETLEPEEPAESREGMILNHAIRESYYDVLTFLAGGKVPTIKTADEISTEREQPLESIHAGRETSGLSYSDYLS